ncbi:MAG: AAA family ATPase [Planctomycetota bacterium]|nr:AAA family ATPase [Planctomycetota bacterium]
MTSLDEFLEQLNIYVRARYPLLYIVTWEEERAEQLLRRAAADRSKAIYVWTQTEGFHGKASSKGYSAVEALNHVLSSAEKAIFVLKDFHPFMKEDVVIRRLRDIVADLKRSYKTLVLLSPILEVPPELEKDITVLDLPLPDEADLRTCLREFLETVKGRIDVRHDPDLEEKVVKASLGFTLSQAENVFARAIIADRAFSMDDLHLILAEKKQIVRKSGFLEFYDLGEDFKQVGGLDNLKLWLENRSHAFTDRARVYGLPEPKGLLLLGVQGCGKSLTAKAIASLWGLPLLRFDVGTVFGSYIGQTEANMRRALKMAEALSPAVLWLDEIEKAFAGSTGNSSADSGVSARVFGAFLTWLQEKKKPVFVVATANNVKSLPPELLRKGRFDEIFFVDLPNQAEREGILEIHLKKRNRDPGEFPLAELAREAEGFSGAELEEAIVSSMYSAFPEGREINGEDIARALKETVPLSVLLREDIQALRSWASQRARSASGKR